MENQVLWNRFKSHLLLDPTTGFSLDISRMRFEASFFPSMGERIQSALSAMAALEKGAIANPDEKRMVGHYWLRDSSRAPNPEIQNAIEGTFKAILEFVDRVHRSDLRPEKGSRFKHLLVVGIGGSALGPQLVSRALSTLEDKMTVHFFDNTDPDGMNFVLARIPELAETLTVIISKSGGTKETRNGQLFAKAAYQAKGLSFAKHAVAVTGEGSELDSTAVAEKWLARFPMWDWVGGRTSELSAVGLLPAALQGINISKMRDGAKCMDEMTRRSDVAKNPAALLALMWFHATGGKGLKDMVILPYRDRLELMSRYLQQLVMESLGKERDLNGKTVHQGIAVYGNKGSTDQHAYIQQLRDGVPNFFATFITVLEDRCPQSATELVPMEFPVEKGVTAGDYLHGFFLGTRTALFENDRESITITLKDVSPFSIGMLIALFERAVGLYASLVNINAYHQPGVEAGKKAAGQVLKIQMAVIEALVASGELTVDELSGIPGVGGDAEAVFHILQRLVSNGRVISSNGADPLFARYSMA